MDATTVAVNLAKDVFQVALANRGGRIIDYQRLTRRQFERFLDTVAVSTEVIMESCGLAHYWGRRAQARGLRVRLLPVQYVRPYVRRNKTDRMDTEALLEAARCGEIRPVPVKTVEQQTLQAIHRVRTQWQTARVARINSMRGLLREHGHAIPVGARTVLRRVTAILEDADAELPEMLRHTLGLVVDEVRALEAKIAGVDRQLAQIAAAHPVASRLQTIPGVGVLTATALIGAVNHIHAFRRGREFASWLGLTPRESSTGGDTPRAEQGDDRARKQARAHRVGRVVSRRGVSGAAAVDDGRIKRFLTRRDAQRGKHTWHDGSDRRRDKPITPLTLEVAFH